MGSKPKPSGVPEKVQKEIKKLEQERLKLQKNANKQQQQEMGLLKQQIQANSNQYKEQLGLFRAQIDNSSNALSEYQAQIGLATQLQEEQLERQRQETAFSQNVQSINRGVLSAQQSKGMKNLQRRSTYVRGNVGRGIFTAGERR